METNSDLIIKIPANSPTAQVSFNKDNLVRQKNIAIDDLVSTLASSYKFSTGVLPFGTRIFSGSSNRYVISIEAQAKIRDLNIRRYKDRNSEGNEQIQVPFPNCLFTFYIKNKVIYGSWMFALKGNFQIETDKLYMFPFSNVYADGKICWGTVGLPGIDKPSFLSDVIVLFFNSQYNGDMGGAFVAPKDKPEICDFWSFTKYLADKKEFPTECLRDMGRVFSDYKFEGRD